MSGTRTVRELDRPTRGVLRCATPGRVVDCKSTSREGLVPCKFRGLLMRAVGSLVYPSRWSPLG